MDRRFTAAAGRRHALLADSTWRGPFAFVVLADPQLGLYKKDTEWALWVSSDLSHSDTPSSAAPFPLPLSLSLATPTSYSLICGCWWCSRCGAGQWRT